MKWNDVFTQEKSIIGMIHVPALPGTPLSKLEIRDIISSAIREAHLYEDMDLDGIMIENMHDTPYLNQSVGPEIIACMSVIGYQIRQEVNIPCGVQILASANKEALACAQAAGFSFIRAEGYVFGHVADEGYTESCAGELLRYRKQIGAEDILILTDIKKKHSSHAITSDVSIEDTAHAAEFFLSDGLIITGSSTGQEAGVDDLTSVRNSTRLPILIGSGITADNLGKYWSLADGFIVGSYFKENGLWKNSLSSERVQRLMDAVHALRIT